jgi:hypothetical protein
MAPNEPIRRIGISEGLDLEARFEVNKGFFGSIRDANLPEIGPFHQEDDLRSALSEIALVYRRYESDSRRTLGSDEFKDILDKYHISCPG